MEEVHPLQRLWQLRGGCHQPPGIVAVRDTKDGGNGPVLIFTPAEWDAFVGGTKDGEFDR